MGSQKRFSGQLSSIRAIHGKAEVERRKQDIALNSGCIFESITSSFTQFSSQVGKPQITVSLITNAHYQEHQLSGWHNITSVRDDLTNTRLSRVIQKISVHAFLKLLDNSIIAKCQKVQAELFISVP